MGPVFGVIAAIASVVGTVASIAASSKAAKARQKQEQLQRRRSARMAVREAQIRRAQAVATAQGAGALGSSGAAGGIGSLNSQLGEQLGFSSQYSALSNIVTRQSANASAFGSFANFSSQFADFNALGNKLNFGQTPQSTQVPMNLGSQYGSSAYPVRMVL